MRIAVLGGVLGVLLLALYFFYTVISGIFHLGG